MEQCIQIGNNRHWMNPLATSQVIHLHFVSMWEPFYISYNCFLKWWDYLISFILLLGLFLLFFRTCSFGYTLNYVRGRHFINEGFVVRTEKIMYCKHWITKTRWSMHFQFIFFMAVWISLLVLGISVMPLAPAELHEKEIRRNGLPSES